MKILIEKAKVERVLEALMGNWRTDEEMKAFHGKQMQAIADIQEALAQPEQEPVAVVTSTPQANKGLPDVIGVRMLTPLLPNTKLYTTPPAQRQARSADTWVKATTWVGLTDEDINDLVKEFDGLPITLSYAIEAKLKEKNT